ncbi:hypothetical protein FE633_03830 [Streptomyces montanus]|uniref:Uncharacterized protein n=1 Tax=Streptomyces montanus TaxID=2580423 RepID=A0A5R9G418_9ACTN|nr:hypothetical protein [Streptomyces montanus]TLS47624.1 hypothetical protein FE633_03830 [Streptomyces montanus]
MSRIFRMSRRALTAAATAGLVVGTAVPALAQNATDDDKVVVFTTEIDKLHTYSDPQGCHRLPLAAHTLNNHTSGIVYLYPDPFCTSVGIPILPEHGMHTPPVGGSFSA